MRPIVGRAASLTPVDFDLPAGDHVLLAGTIADAGPLAEATVGPGGRARATPTADWSTSSPPSRRRRRQNTASDRSLAGAATTVGTHRHATRCSKENIIVPARTAQSGLAAPQPRPAATAQPTRRRIGLVHPGPPNGSCSQIRTFCVPPSSPRHMTSPTRIQRSIGGWTPGVFNGARISPGYQIRTRVAGSSHSSSLMPTSNAP
jgi:hypothetical protein